MRTSVRARLAVPLLLAAVLTPAASSSAASWTEVATPSTSTITNLEWHDAELFWTTANGRVFRRAADGTITERYSTGGTALSDIEFQPGGNVGFAVGVGGKVVRTANGGADWTAISGITASNEGDGSGNKCTVATPLNTDLNFVRWAGPNRVFIGGSKRQIVAASSSTLSAVGQSAAVWVDANRKLPAVAGDNCRLNYTEPFIDLAPASPSSFFTTNFAYAQYLGNYDDDTSESDERSFMANGNRVGGRLAIDPDNPARMWSVSGGAPYGSSGARFTENGWNDYTNISTAGGYPGDDSPWDVDYSGGTVLMVGSQGKILTSVNGKDFTNLPAGGALATAEWHAVHLASPTQAAIGGVGGKLAITSDANTLPAPVVTTPPATTPPTTTPPTTNPPTTKPPTTALPAPRLGGSATKPPLVGGAAIIEGKRVVLRVRGTLGLPTGISKKAACKGKMRVAVIKGKGKKARTLKSKRITVKSNCRYAGKITVLRRKVGSATRLRLRVVFPGNTELRKVGQTYAVRVRPAK